MRQDANTSDVEPFPRAVVIVASNHVTKAHLLAVAVCRLARVHFHFRNEELVCRVGHQISYCLKGENFDFKEKRKRIGELVTR